MLLLLFRSAFLIATRTSINQEKDLNLYNMKILRIVLVVVQSILLISTVVINCLLFSYDLLDNDPSVKNYGTIITDAQFYFIAGIFILFIITLSIVDILLLKRLKIFYPNFYKKEKKKVIL